MSAEKAAAWIRKAESDLLAADNNLAAANIPFDVVCFHCQQAAEKYRPQVGRTGLHVPIEKQRAT